MKTLIRELIANVKMHPSLYDADHLHYKSMNKNNQLWAEISTKLNKSDYFLRRQWRFLRNKYVKYIRSLESTEEETERCKTWTWAKEMEFLRPYLKLPSAKSTITTNFLVEEHNTSLSDSRGETKDNMTVINEKENVICQELTGTDSQDVREEKQIQEEKRKSRTSGPDNFMSSLENTDNTQLMFSDDAIDLLFLGLAESVKTFSSERQAVTKLKIVSLVLEQEMQQQEEDKKSSEFS